VAVEMLNIRRRARHAAPPVKLHKPLDEEEEPAG
jgi:hypothetical protein